MLMRSGSWWRRGRSRSWICNDARTAAPPLRPLGAELGRVAASASRRLRRLRPARPSPRTAAAAAAQLAGPPPARARRRPTTSSMEPDRSAPSAPSGDPQRDPDVLRSRQDRDEAETTRRKTKRHLSSPHIPPAWCWRSRGRPRSSTGGCRRRGLSGRRRRRAAWSPPTGPPAQRHELGGGDGQSRPRAAPARSSPPPRGRFHLLPSSPCLWLLSMSWGSG